MPATKINVRDWTIEIQSKDATPVWTAIGNLKNMTIGRTSVNVDLTDGDSAGMEETQIMQRGKTLTFEGSFLEDASGTRDAGQDLVEDAAGAVGDDSHYGFRVTTPAGTVETWADAVFEVSDVGGGHNDKTSWGFTVTRSGASS